MLRSTLALLGAGLVCASLAATNQALAADRSAEAIIKDIDAAVMPTLDASRRRDPAAVSAYETKREKVQSRQQELAGQLLRVDPGNRRLARFLPRRWSHIRALGSFSSLTEETERVIAAASDRDLTRVATYWQVVAGMETGADPAEARVLLDRLLAVAPEGGGDETTPQMLFSLGRKGNPDVRRAVLDVLLAKFPRSRTAAMAGGALRQLEGVGKPVTLEFTDAVRGSAISMKRLKGKVVVLDFWATWCGPCVKEMPRMKRLYAEYKDKGVEFIGVNLDQKQGGLGKLRAFVKEKEIPWPQYYQGNGWESEFSVSWGIDAIPAMLVIDQEGKLFSAEARGSLETTILELLYRAKAGASPASGGGP